MVESKVSLRTWGIVFRRADRGLNGEGSVANLLQKESRSLSARKSVVVQMVIKNQSCWRVRGEEEVASNSRCGEKYWRQQLNRDWRISHMRVFCFSPFGLQTLLQAFDNVS